MHTDFGIDHIDLSDYLHIDKHVSILIEYKTKALAIRASNENNFQRKFTAIAGSIVLESHAAPQIYIRKCSSAPCNISKSVVTKS